MSRLIVLAGAAASLGACATSHAGWSGSGAQPFDASLTGCTTTTQNIPDANTRATALNQCMAAKGWTRK